MRADRAGGEHFADLHERALLVTQVMECSVVLEFLLLEACEILVGPNGVLARFAVVAADSGGLVSVVANGGGALRLSPDPLMALSRDLVEIQETLSQYRCVKLDCVKEKKYFLRFKLT